MERQEILAVSQVEDAQAWKKVRRAGRQVF